MTCNLGVLRGKRAYLSGPIEHGEPGHSWRLKPKDVLINKYGIDVFDPFDDPKQVWAKVLYEARDRSDYEAMSEIAHNFVSKDLSMVDRADLVIAYLPYKVPTTGTIHEIVYSNDRKKPTLLISPEGKNRIPLWFYGLVRHQYMFGCWEDLFAYLDEVEEGLHKDDRRWAFTYDLI